MSYFEDVILQCFEILHAVQTGRSELNWTPQTRLYGDLKVTNSEEEITLTHSIRTRDFTCFDSASKNTILAQQNVT